MRHTATSYRPSKSSTTVLLVFVVAVLALAYFNEPLLVSRVQNVSLTSLTTLKKKKPKFPFPDFNRYIHSQTLTPKEFGLEAPDERVIIVGDTHGMNGSLHNLLSTVQYNPHKDTLFLAGDILAKSTEAGSLAILDFLSQHRQGNCYVHASADASPDPKSATSAQRKQAACKQVYAVRGNHDQMIVQWRAWRQWFEGLQLTFPSAQSYPRRIPPLAQLNSNAAHTTSASYDAGPPVGTGSQFLALIESEWLRDRTSDPTGAGADAQEWVDTMRKRAVGTWREEWWRRIPQPGKGRASKDFIMLGDHYWIARDMSPEHAEFLFSLPLVIHVPSEHFFLVHGGLLPSDPRRPADDEHQPLAHPPSPDDDEHVEPDDDHDYDYPILDPASAQRTFSRAATLELDDEVEELRVLQERALIHDVPHNRDPWVVLNIRSVRKGGKVSRRSDKGTPWAKIWNGQMKRCGGFRNATAPADSSLDEDEDDSRGDGARAHPLPCYPSTVVYGHAASRDLDVRRWTVGLDTGCLYGRRLTALVLTRAHHEHEKYAPSPSRTIEDDDEDESSEEEEDEDEYAHEGPFEGVNDQFARVAGGSVVSRSRRPKSWTRKIRFGDKHSDLAAKLVSVKCPKMADLS